MSAAPNGDPVSCFTLGHDWSGWAHDFEALIRERWCEREGCGARERRPDRRREVRL